MLYERALGYKASPTTPGIIDLYMGVKNAELKCKTKAKILAFHVKSLQNDDFQPGNCHFSGRFNVKTDASDYQMGGGVSQEGNPIGFIGNH